MISIVFFFIQFPYLSSNKTVVIKTMISDKRVFHFQHCDNQLTLVIVVQLPRLPVDVFCFIEIWSNGCFRQASLFSVLSKLRQVHTYYVFFSKQQFHVLQCSLRCSFYMLWWLSRSLFPFYVFSGISLAFSMTCSFVPSVYYCRCFKQKKNKIKKQKNKKQTCQWTLTLTCLVGFQTNKRTLSYIRLVLIDPTNDMLQTHKPLNLNIGTFYEV